jgi:hypothetical protein
MLLGQPSQQTLVQCATEEILTRCRWLQALNPGPQFRWTEWGQCKRRISESVQQAAPTPSGPATPTNSSTRAWYLVLLRTYTLDTVHVTGNVSSAREAGRIMVWQCCPAQHVMWGWFETDRGALSRFMRRNANAGISHEHMHCAGDDCCKYHTGS